MRMVIALTGTMLIANCLGGSGLVRFADPFVGTAGHGHCYPGAAVPFGMVQASPDTGRNNWHYCGGYRYEDRRYYGFSQTHISGTGIPSLGDFRLFAYTSAVTNCVKVEDLSEEIDKSREIASPGYYSLTGAQTGLRTEVTCSGHSAVYRITPSVPGEVKLLLDASWGVGCWPAKTGKPIESGVLRAWAEGASADVSASVWVRRKCHSSWRFSRPAKRIERRAGTYGFKDSAAVFAFELVCGEPLVVKVGLSGTSADRAARNLEAEIPDFDFDRIRRAAESQWETAFSNVRIESDDVRELRKWYTALYHVYLQPGDISDVGSERGIYSAISGWDVFRAAMPFLSLTHPDRVAGIANAMLAHGRRQGFLPIWSLWDEDALTMVGHHAVAMLAEAQAKGIGGVDYEEAYRLVRESLLKEHGSWPKKEIFQPNEDWQVYDRYGYYPFDLIPGESVSRTLECSYDDAAAARMATRLGRTADAEMFRRRSCFWTNVIDSTVGFARGRDSKGRWRTPFDPGAIGHSAETENDFTEGNSWQYTWHVLQDPRGLIERLGGRDAAREKLDKLFVQKTQYDARHVDVDGLIGQYAHGNEPSHHVVYLYPYMDAPWRTAELVRQIVTELYTDRPDGLCGNEDCGQMSAWYLFSVLGFYPVDPASGDYVLGAPQVPNAVLRLPDGKVFTVVAEGLSKANKYVRRVTLNGRPLVGPVLRHADILRGGELVFTMSERACSDGQ